MPNLYAILNDNLLTLIAVLVSLMQSEYSLNPIQLQLDSQFYTSLLFGKP